jgi:uncharacterized integral membrane protein (TIGR00697 family)
MNKSSDNIFQYKYLWLSMMSYLMVMVMSDWFVVRIVTVFGITIDAGTVIFPLTFLISDLITEVYGYKHARRSIWAAFVFNIIFVLLGQILIHMPGPDFAAENNAAFNKLFSLSSRIVIISFVAYMISETINSYFVAKLKILCKGDFMGLRFVASTLVSVTIDTVIFRIFAYMNEYEISDIIQLILNVLVIKIVIELIGLPISIRLAKKLKQIEQIDIYDTGTDFNPFSLNTEYTAKNNLYQKMPLND